MLNLKKILLSGAILGGGALLPGKTSTPIDYLTRNLPYSSAVAAETSQPVREPEDADRSLDFWGYVFAGIGQAAFMGWAFAYVWKRNKQRKEEELEQEEQEEVYDIIIVDD